MPAFAYRAYLDNGRTEKGHLDAKTRDEAVRMLVAQGRKPYFVTAAKSDALSKSQSWNWTLELNKTVDLGRLFGELSVLLNAGFPVDRALATIVAGETSRVRHGQLQQVLDMVTAGRTVADSFGSLPTVGPDAVALLASGERSGTLASLCQRLSDSFETRARRRRAVLDALAYPAFLLLAMGAALTVLATVLAPALEPLFEGSADGPPFTLAMLSFIGHVVTGYPFAIPLTALVGLLMWLLLSRSRQTKVQCSAALLKLPVIGPSLKNAAAARYLGTLGLLVGNGVPMNEALHLASATTNNVLVKGQFDEIEDAVANGDSLHRAIERTRFFDGATKSLIAIGEDANTLPLVLSRAAGVIETALNRRIDKSVKLLTPILTISLGLLVGSLVISVMTTILSINDMALK